MGRMKHLTIGLLTLLTMMGLKPALALAQGPAVVEFSIAPNDTISTGAFTVTVRFDQKMDTTSAYSPEIRFGLQNPFDTFLMTESTGWTDTTHYQATYTVTPSLPPLDGLYGFSVRHFRNEGGDTLATNPTFPAQQLLIDRHAPVTSHSFNNSVWYTSNVNVNFTVNDTADGQNGAGISKIFYSVNGGGTTTIDVPPGTVTRNYSVLVTTEGANNQIQYWSQDVLGNLEPVKTLSGIKIDKTAPSVAGFTITPNDTVTTGPFTVTVVFSEKMDTTSAYNPKILFGRQSPYADFTMTQSANWADSIRYQATFTITPLTATPPTPPQDGLYRFSVRDFRDFSGNTLAPNPTVPTPKLLIDRSAPVTTHSFDTSVWYNTNKAVAFTAADTAHGHNGAGLRLIRYSVNNGDTTTINVPAGTVTRNYSVTVSSEGANNRIRYWAEDVLGHKETSKVLSGIKIDKTAPTATVNNLNSLYRTLSFNVPVVSSDNLSGVKWVKLYYRKQSEGIWRVYANPTAADSLFQSGTPIPFVGEDNTIYHFEAVAVDSANNIEARTGVPEDTTHIDLVRPKLTDITFIHKFEVTDTVCFGDVTIELSFDVNMNTTSVPVVTWGLDEPYNSFNIITSASNWITSKIWQGVFTVTPNVPDPGKDGRYGFQIRGAEAASSGLLMEPTLTYYMNTPVPFDVNNLGKRLLVDRGAPFVTHMPAFNINVWHKQVIFTIDAADTASPGLEGSGVKSITYAVNGAETVVSFDTPELERSTPPDTITQEGTNNTLYYHAADFCGNSGAGGREIRLTGIKIDHTPPLVRVIAPTVENTSDLVFDVHYDDSDTTDNLSGVKQVELWFRKDGGSWTRYGGGGAVYTSSPISFNATTTGEGVYDFEAVGVDSAGNRQRTGSPQWTTNVAIPKPVVTKLVWIYQDNETDTVGIGAVTLQLQFNRAMNTSSVVNVAYARQAPYESYNVSGQNTQWIDDTSWEGTFTVSQSVPECDGLYGFRIKGAMDTGGVEMDELRSYDPDGQFQKRLLIDRNSPVTTIRLDSTTYNMATGWWYRTDIQARLIAQDVITAPENCAGTQGAGVTSFFFQVNNNAVAQKNLLTPSVLADTTFKISTEGSNNTVRFWAVDALDHVEPVNGDNIISGIRLDKTPPQATASSPDTSKSLTFNVQWTGVDPAPAEGEGVVGVNLSGLRSVELWYRSDVNQTWTKLGDYVSSPVSFTGEDDRVYEFEAVGIDSAGNVESRRGVAESMTVIGTPKPLLTRVAFIYNTTVTDTVAKGVTVIELGFNTKMDITVTPTISYGLQQPYNTFNLPHIGTQWITDRIFQATFTVSDDIPTTDGVYGFRIAGAKAAADGLGTEMETTFSSGIEGGRFLLIDRMVPTAPTSLAASPSGWTNASSVTLSWQNPADLSGIASVWYRIGAEPQSKGDGIQIDQRNIHSLSISTVGLASGTYPVYIWLQDLAGNLNQQNRSMVRFKTDKVAPVFTPSSLPTETDEDASITFGGTVVEDVGIDLSASKLYYRQGGESTETAVGITQNDGTLSATVPGAASTPRGLYLRAVISDSAGNTVTQPEWYVKVLVPAGMTATTQPGGTSAEFYRLLSIPLILDAADAVSVLQDDLGDPDGGKNWRLLEWDPVGEAFKEYPDVSPFAPGKSFFLISKEEKPITPGAGASVPSDDPYSINLKKGWNLIGVPFAFAVDVGALSFQGGNPVGPVWGYDGSWAIANTLQPWKGYAVYAEQDETLLVAPNESTASTSKSGHVLSAGSDEWMIQILARKGAARDEVNYLGARNVSEVAIDALNYHEPPVISDVTVYFPKDRQDGRRELYATDFRPIADGADGYAWTFVVRSSGSGTVELEFSDIATIPANFEAFLIDTEAEVARDLRKSNRYDYLAVDNVREKTLTLVVGSKAFVQENNQGIALQPTKFQLSQNYPNPFNPETTIRYAIPERATVTLEVYNLMGQRVRTLVSQQPQDAGYYLAHWDGRNDSGLPVASGVYITYLRSGTFVASRKMVLMK